MSESQRNTNGSTHNREVSTNSVLRVYGIYKGSVRSIRVTLIKGSH